ncbi:MAG: peptide chain release factor N(5)-glutamine methyltransferase [Desulfuromonas sp.]|nr:MAG: peptide chain release factor N(5)-glutamine methyltransferase [Desulfuromonas sp.]
MAETWTVLKVLQWTAGHLSDKGVESARLDAELLLADLLALDRVGLYLNYDRPLQEVELTAYRERVKRRAGREPLQYLLGRTEFWSLALNVSPAVLIPRPETEILVEEALKRLPSNAATLDVGTGSGAIALALAHERRDLKIIGLDASADALQVAAANGARLALQERVEWSHGDLHQLPAGPFDMVVSNPPYIPKADLAGLMPEVQKFEPQVALDGGIDGLEAYRALSSQTDSLSPGGWLLVEVGIGQAEDVRELFGSAGLGELFVRNDLADIPRVVGGRRCA